MTEFDERYLRGIEMFNSRRFYDAHEIWEDLWHEEHGEANKFIQGLIQFATCLHHFEASNLKGAKLLYEAGVELLTPYGDVFWGLPVKDLIAAMTVCVQGLLSYDIKDLPGRYHPEKGRFPVQIEEGKIPLILLNTRSPLKDKMGS
jgi:hypothetical protein